MANINLSITFQRFFESEKTGGFLLIVATVLALIVANSSLGAEYHTFWHISLLGISLEHWVNDGLMAIFFLLIGLELERELYHGELSTLSNALLPMFAAIGGMLAPALIHYGFNANTPFQAGMGIPMATDIAFALGILSMLGARVPASLKVFLVAFAVIDDLGAAIIIALFYTANISLPYLAGAIGVLMLLIVLNRLRVMSLLVYLLGGALMWWLTLKSGVHATLAGIALAFAIPFNAKLSELKSPSSKLEHCLHQPVAFVILPIFALANTGIEIGADWFASLISSSNSVGIMAGLLIGKSLGVFMFARLAVALGLCQLPTDVNFKQIFGVGLLGGIGFTMSIFITNLAFANSPDVVNSAKMAILMGSLISGILGFIWLSVVLRKNKQS